MARSSPCCATRLRSPPRVGKLGLFEAWIVANSAVGMVAPAVPAVKNTPALQAMCVVPLKSALAACCMSLPASEVSSITGTGCSDACTRRASSSPSMPGRSLSVITQS